MRHRGDEVCLTLGGELDLAVAGQLEAALDEAFALHPRTLTVDVDGVQYIDSQSIGILVRARNIAVANDHSFTVVNPRGLVLRVLQTMGLLELFVQQPSNAKGLDR